MKKILLSFYFSLYTSLLFSQVWKPLSPLLYGWGEPAQIYTLKVYNNKLLIGGAIRKIGNYVLPQPQFGYWTKPLTWDGYLFDSVPGLNNFESVVNCFAEFNNKLYCSGYFQNVNNLPNTKYIARFNGTNMESLANVIPNSNVNTLKAKDYLYLGGGFTYIGSTLFRNIARYNGTNYSSVGGGVQGGLPHINILDTYNNEIIAGGVFAYAGTGYANNIASWNGTTWNNMENGLNGTVNDLVVDSINNFLYVSGSQTQLGNGNFVSSIVRWNGHYWEDTGLPNNLLSMVVCMYNKELYTSIFPLNSADIDTIIMHFDGVNWISIPGLNWAAHNMCVYNDDLYLGGGFTMAGTDSVNGIVALHVAPPTGCNWLIPRVFTNSDTFYLGTGQADVQFYNNNAYANSWQWDFGDSGTDNVKDPLHSYTAAGTYTATVTVTDSGCVKTAQKIITILNGSGLEEYTKEKLNFKIYPNPTYGGFTIELSDKTPENLELKIYKQHGGIKISRSILKGERQIHFSTKDWSASIYYVGIYSENKLIKTEELVIK